MLLYTIRVICILSLILGGVYFAVKKFEMHFDEKLLDKISDDVKIELKKSPSYSLMSEDKKQEFKKGKMKDIFGLWIVTVILTIVIAPIYGDLSLSDILWANVPFLFIFIYFGVRDSLRVAKFRKVYEIRAYCAARHHERASFVYYDYKKMQYCITTIPVSTPSQFSYKDFCWAMAVEKRESVKVIDVSPRVYEKEGNKR